MIVLSIDPAWAKPMAYAVFENQQLRYFDRTEELHELLAVNADVVVTEEPYCRKGDEKDYSYTKGGRLGAFRALCYSVGIVYAIAKLQGADFATVRPVDWKTFWKVTQLTPPHFREMIRTEISEGAKDEDEQDAIMIGKYYIGHVLVLEENR